MNNWSNYGYSLYKYSPNSFNINISPYIPRVKEVIEEIEIIEPQNWRKQLSSFSSFLKPVKFKITIKTEKKIVNDDSVWQIGNNYYCHPEVARIINEIFAEANEKNNRYVLRINDITA